MTALRETRPSTIAQIRNCDNEAKSLMAFKFARPAPSVAHVLREIRETRTGAQMAALLSDPQIRAAVFGPDIPEG
jgi:hypothetical protein